MTKNLFLILLLSCVVHARADDTLLEFRISQFYPNSSDMRELFGDGVNFQLTGSCPLCDGPDRWLDGVNLWAAVDYFSKSGRSIGLDEKTTLRMVPLTLGLKCFFPLNFYAAGGLKYYFVRTHNDSDFVKKTVKIKGLGAVVETGFITPLCNGFLLDVFMSYSFKSFGAPFISNPAVESLGLNVGGINVGAGIGYRF